jgi:hypothetical protein
MYSSTQIASQTAITLELAKDVVDRQARQAVARQVAPGVPGAQQAQDGVHRRPHVGLARSSAAPARSLAPAGPTPIPQAARKLVALAPVNQALPSVHIAARHHGESRYRESRCHASRNDLSGHALGVNRLLLRLRRVLVGRPASGPALRRPRHCLAVRPSGTRPWRRRDPRRRPDR